MPLNQYHVVMEVAPEYWQSPERLNDIYVSTAGGAISGAQATSAVVPSTAPPSIGSAAVDPRRGAQPATNAIANTGRGSPRRAPPSAPRPRRWSRCRAQPLRARHTPLAVNHQGLFVASTISFNLVPGKSLCDAIDRDRAAMARIGMPATIHGSFQGTARAFQQSLANQLLLVLAALVAVYIVLGILYESYIHPITILSTLPSAGIGALLALMISTWSSASSP